MITSHFLKYARIVRYWSKCQSPSRQSASFARNRTLLSISRYVDLLLNRIRRSARILTSSQNCLGDLPNLTTLHITTWPNNNPSTSKLPRKVYEHLLQMLAQQGFERSAAHAAGQNRTSKLAIIAWGCSDRVYDREDSLNQVIFVKGHQIDPLGQEKFTAVQIGWCLRKFIDAGSKSDVLDFSLSRSMPPPTREDSMSSDDSD